MNIAELVKWARGCAKGVQELVITADPHMCIIDAISYYQGADAFADWLWDDGYACLGAGVFSAAFTTPHPEYVLKVGFAAKHDGGLEWQHFCHEYHSTLPMLPEVVHVESFGGGDFYFVLVRRYEELTHGMMSSEEEAAWLCCLSMLTDSDALEHFHESVLTEDDWACLELLQEITQELGYRVDFHAGNCLWEWDGTSRRPIINDPFSYSLDEYY